MDYKATIDYLFTKLPMYQRVGAVAMKKDLGNILLLCEALGSPHKKFKSIHLAGTNGKGSTAHITAAVLQQAGYKVGLYTSPHFRDFRERIKVNGNYIGEKAVVNFVEHNLSIINKIQPSFFEITVAMAFQHFAQEAVDIAVIETGLGGRLDSTNIIQPLVSVITNIGMDHEAMLGNTLAQIAGEKAGIIKQQTPVIIGERHEETTQVFEDKSKTCKAPIIFAEDLISIQTQETTLKQRTFKVSSKAFPLINFDALALDLTGDYQIQNLRTALCTLALLNETPNVALTSKIILDACKQVQSLSKLIGRWQILEETPLTICDGGHNADGLKYVTKGLYALSKKLHIVLGTVKDKDLNKMLPMLPKEATFYFAKANIPRGLDADILLQKATQLGLKGTAFDSVDAAYKAAQKNAHQDDCIFIGGSIFVVAEVV